MSEQKTRERFAGILLHPTSLPGRSGIGDIGAPARRFVDFLAAADQSLWQICPLGPTGYGDSPYASFSAFAGNPLLISLERLVEDGLIEPVEYDAYLRFSDDRVDYGAVIQAKSSILAAAASRFHERAPVVLQDAFTAFRREHTDWLADYALFMALKDSHDGAVWNTWDEGLARRHPDALAAARDELAHEIDRIKVTQFLFFNQWWAIKAYANERGVRIIGDTPIFVAYDSADAWSRRELFQLDDAGNPTVVAGVPPDYFSPTGQLWGNPLYRWDAMQDDGYAWWVDRLRMALTTADLIRLDHFRGFEAYWEVPAGAETAQKGRWVRGPGDALFEKIRETFGDPLPIIAEDLGVITERVDALRKRFNLPGMKVLQFAFGDETEDSVHLPHNVEVDCVVYSGTHDNDTTAGWYADAPAKAQDHARRYLWCGGSDIHLDMIRAAMMSPARMAVIPMQDLLGLGSEARLNTPGGAEGNWQWRLREDQLTRELADSLRAETRLYGRGEPAEREEEEADDPSLDPDQAADI